MKISGTLRQTVKDSTFTINSLALASGVPQSVLHRFYRDEQDITLKTADKLADFFGLTLVQDQAQKAAKKPRRKKRPSTSRK